MHKNNTENKIKVSLEFHNNIFDFYRKRDKSSSSQNSFMKWVLPFGTKRRWLFDQGLNRVGILVSKGWRSFWNDRVLEGIRARNKELSRRKALIDKGKRQWGGKRILYILPVIYRAGGAYVIFQESKAMLDMGVNVCLMNLKQYKEKFESNYPELELPVIYSEPKNIGIIAKRFDAVISTMNTVVNWLEYIIEKNGKPLRGYYIQDFEPYFYEETSTDFKIAMESYILFSDIIRLTKTKWNEEIVKVKTGAICHVVGPSVDIDLFMPRPRYKEDSQNRPICIGAMIRPTSPRRGPLLTMKLLREVWLRHKYNIKIITFGCTKEELNSLNILNDFTCHFDILSRKELAWLFNEIDIFVDFSSYQAMGLTALEAMACGAAVIVPSAGGSKEFVAHEINGLIVDTSSEEDCLDSLNRLILDDKLRIKLGRQALKDVCQYSPEKAAYNTLLALFPINEENSV